MLPVYICDDLAEELNLIKRYVIEAISSEKLTEELKIECVSTNPDDIINHLKNNIRPSLYFLDFDLGPDAMTGLDLGVEIRDLDCRGYIVMITTYSYVAPLTFEYKVEALDFIVKDDILGTPKRIKECILKAHERFLKDEIQKVDKKIEESEEEHKNEMVVIEAMPKHKLKVLQNDGSSIEISNTLKDIKNLLGDAYYQCHKSYIINLNYIKEIDRKNRKVLMLEGEQIPVSRRAITDLERVASEQEKLLKST